MTISNKTTTLVGPDEKLITYADLLFMTVNKPIPEGIDIATMRRGLRIIGIIEEAKSKDAIVFDKDDSKYVKELVEKSTWGAYHKDILDFVDYIAEIQ